MNQLGLLDWGIVVAYCVGVVALGIWVTRRGAGENTDNYFLSGRNLPWWIAGASMAASAFSVDTPLYVSNLTQKSGVAGNWEWWYFGVSGILGATIMARYWRRTGIMTDLELIALRYSGGAAKVLRGFRAAFFALIVNPLGMAAVIAGMIKILGVVEPTLVGESGWPEGTGVWIIGGVIFATVTYSVLSGFMGVVLTDLIQFAISIVGAIVMAWSAVGKVGGLGALAAHERVAPKLDFLPSLSPSGWTEASTAFCIFLGVSWWTFVNADGGGKFIQRMASCRTERDSEWASWFSTITFVALRSWPWILVGLAGLILYQPGSDPETFYPRLMMQLSPGLRGLVFASLIAAFMSTIDTQLNWGASYLVNDLIRPFVLKDWSERNYVWIARLCAIPTLGMVLLFFWFSHAPADAHAAKGALSVTVFLRGVILVSSGLGAVYLLRWFWWRLTAWGEITAMVAAPLAAWACKQNGLEFAPATLVVTSVTVAAAMTGSLYGTVFRRRSANLWIELWRTLLIVTPLGLVILRASPWLMPTTHDALSLNLFSLCLVPPNLALAGQLVVIIFLNVWLIRHRRLPLESDPARPPRHVDPRHLQAFYDRVKPAGLWGRFRRRSEGEPPRTGLLLASRFVAGNLILFGLTFTLGGLLLGKGWLVVLRSLILLVWGLVIDYWARGRLAEEEPNRDLAPADVSNPEGMDVGGR